MIRVNSSWVAVVVSALSLGCASGSSVAEASSPGASRAAIEDADVASQALAQRSLPPDPIVDPPSGGPTVNVWPAHGARFVPGARFDIRVEGTGAGPDYGFAASLKIDGVAQTFTSGTADSNTTDGISSPDWGGFNIRGYSNSRPGVHELDATFTSSQGTKRVKSYFVVERLEARGKAHRIQNVIFLLGDGMGVGVRTAARVARYGVARGSTRGWLEMDRFPSTGLQRRTRSTTTSPIPRRDLPRTARARTTTTTKRASSRPTS